ncbi:MAG: hypothetical protein LBN71_09505 [Tannerella sp.]|jgi:hypothetical protein|nr:hypothetical protein [Tannerella sp.]
MFYARINKIHVFNNREGFLGLFNRAELRIYSFAANPTGVSGHILERGIHDPLLTVADLINLDDEKRREKLLEAVLTETEHFAQSHSLEINGVKDNQSLTFDESGLVLYQSAHIPDALNIQLWVIESDEDVRKFAIDAEKVLESEAFKGLVAAVGTALAVANPILTGVISVGGVVANLLRQKLKVNKDDLVGYWQCALNREGDYPHGIRDRQDVPDSTGNIRVDYTLFGFEKTV